MRRNGQPSRPNAITCCCLSSLKTFLTSSEGISLRSPFNVLSYFRWPVFRCPSLAGFGCPPRSEDKPFVERLVEALDRRALPAWFDRREILVGDSILARINEALEETRYDCAGL